MTKKYKGKYFLDEIDGVVYSTNDYILYNFYNALFYGTEMPIKTKKGKK